MDEQKHEFPKNGREIFAFDRLKRRMTLSGKAKSAVCRGLSRQLLPPPIDQTDLHQAKQSLFPRVTNGTSAPAHRSKFKQGIRG
jgi:hypothetical protein